MHFDVLIMIGFCSGGFAAHVARMRLFAGMRFVMFRKVITPREHFLTNIALIRSGFLVLSHMANTIILPDKLTSADVTRVRSAITMRSKMSVVVCLVDIRFDTQFTFVRFRRSRHMSPSMQLQIPFGSKGFGAFAARERFNAFVYFHVGLQRRMQIRDVANRADNVFDFLFVDEL